MSDSQKEKLLQCYNRGCGQTFYSSKNTPESCTHHPGYPVFHDAYKGWSCCNKKTTDFTEFLNIKGCTNSYHSNVKPPELEKPKTKENDINKDEVYTYKAPLPTKPKEITERPSIDEPMRRLTSSIGSSLRPILEKLQMGNEEETELENSAVVPLNTPCKNGGCKETYKGEISNHDTCVHHPGIPVFHEGLKYWTCCVKRTTDFDSFLEQVGCTTGNHMWFKKKSDEEKKTPCRYDWHQTGNTVVISIYSKCPLPDLSCVEANSVKLCMNISFEGGKKLFNLNLILFGVIDVDKSSVLYSGSKVEIKLKKAELISWKDLIIPTKCLESSVDAADDINELDISND